MEASSITTLVSLVGCVVSAVSATAILLRDPREFATRTASLFVAGTAWWSLCAVMWSAAGTPEEALLWHRLSAPGWAFIGPLALHLVIRVIPRPPAHVAPLLPWLYGLGAFHMLLQMGTHWMHDGVVASRFGWDFQPGRAYGIHLALTYGCVVPAAGLALRAVFQSPSPAERRQARLLATAVAIPFVIATLTGAILPLVGVPTPRLASASFAALGAGIAWGTYRYGFSTLAPGSFSQEILGTLADGVGLVALDGTLIRGNRALAEILGEDPDALAGLPIASRLSIPFLDVDAALRGVECEVRTRSGDPVPAAVSTAPLRDKRDLAMAIVLVLHDLRQISALRDQLILSGRLAAVGELAAGIAHEINNPIAFVRSNLGQLRNVWKDLSSEPDRPLDRARLEDLVSDADELVEESLDGVDRVVAIIRDVRSFAHGGAREHDPLDVNEILEEVIRLASPQLRHHATVVRRFGSPLPPALGSSQELKQVFLNLLVNAAQALEEPGVVEIATRSSADSVEVSIRDEGPGIAPEHLERIFDPFFTTKPVGQGTGLGLAISYQILRAHGASIRVESEPGEGTVFHVSLPRAPSNGPETGPIR